MDDRTGFNEKYIYCSRCGKRNSSNSKYCINCGNKLRSIEDSVRNTAKEVKESIKNSQTYKDFTYTNYDDSYDDNFSEKDMVNFIQKNTDYYISTFKDIKELRKSTSWNWAAFFFNSWWFLYRKMYAYGFGIIIGSFIITSIVPLSGFIINIIISILSGLYGNITYLKYTEKELQSPDRMDEDVKQRILLSRGGVNIVIPVILAVLTIGGILLAGAIGAFFYMFSSPYFY
ncbi:DUF2628 domain-containing protein [Terrisporobacter mayombei]|nr:DUF2628 domain-containing protein [Terrisporobacter mayombei]